MKTSRMSFLAGALLLWLSPTIAVAGWWWSDPDPADTPPPANRVISQRVSYATWYSVPPNSLARQRAPANELTAAHNRLPLHSLVRVTNLSNNKSVFVRITDRGVPKSKAEIDLCKDAAKELEMVRSGVVRVRLQVLREDSAAKSGSGAGAL